MKNEHFEEIETVVEEVFYGRNGVECEEPDAFAKHMTVNGGSSYFIWFKDSGTFDPYNGEILKRSSPLCKFKSVNKDMFDFYIKYLKTKQRIYLTYCRRLLFK